MLKCRDIVQHADAVIDKELGFRRRLAVRTHLYYMRALPSLCAATARLAARYRGNARARK